MTHGVGEHIFSIREDWNPSLKEQLSHGLRVLVVPGMFNWVGTVGNVRRDLMEELDMMDRHHRGKLLPGFFLYSIPLEKQQILLAFYNSPLPSFYF